MPFDCDDATPGRVMTDPDEVRRFLFAGRARLTLTSRATGARYTYRIAAAKDTKTRFFVSLLTGPDNGSDYTYLGTLNCSAVGFCLTRKSSMTEASAPVLAWRYFLDRLLEERRIPANLEVRHEGQCGCCGRVLTVPESIDRGIGPECWSKMS